MLPSRFTTFASIATRTGAQRTAILVLAFCAINAVWSIAGGWTIRFGGKQFHRIDWWSQESGVYSYDGHLIIAIRNGSFMGGSWRAGATTVYTKFPASIDATLLDGGRLFRGSGG